MSRGKKTAQDFVPVGSPAPRSVDSTDENLSAVDIGQDFAVNPPVVLANPNQQ